MRRLGSDTPVDAPVAKRMLAVEAGGCLSKDNVRRVKAASGTVFESILDKDRVIEAVRDLALPVQDLGNVRWRLPSEFGKAERNTVPEEQTEGPGPERGCFST